jgi:aldose 1-epimerase
MGAEAGTSPPTVQGALQPLPPGPLATIARGDLSLDLAPSAGGRIAQIRHRGVEQLLGPDDGDLATIAWGCFPMLPWAGRIRDGRFAFDGRDHRLPVNFGAHAIHGVGFALPWTLDVLEANAATMSLALPADARWPFGGRAEHRIELPGDGSLRMRLALTAGEVAMPATLGWHPWFRKPDRLQFEPDAILARDRDGIAVLPPVAPTPGPWDDCFINTRPVVLHRGGTQLTLRSGCSHWVVFDQLPHTTCVEPQTGMPDAFNADPVALAPGESLEAWTTWTWRMAR